MVKQIVIVEKRLGLVAYTATDWCFWPVVVLNLNKVKYKTNLLSIQMLKWGLGISFCRQSK